MSDENYWNNVSSKSAQADMYLKETDIMAKWQDIIHGRKVEYISDDVTNNLVKTFVNFYDYSKNLSTKERINSKPALSSVSKCLREHGLVYTLKLIFKTLLHR